ncbi:MAG: hypothetical protein WCK40_00800 [Thermoleophilia bacterium]
MRLRSIIRTGLVALVATMGIWTAGTASAAPAAASVAVQMAGKTHLNTVISPTVLQDVGTVKGSPIGSGDITLMYTLSPPTGVAKTTFTITNANGTVTGNCISDYSVTRLHITFTGAGQITGGTGSYAGIKATMLQFAAIHSITGKREAVSFGGRATKPT